MSVIEILQEIDHLPLEALPEVEAAIRNRRESLVPSEAAGVRPGFDELVRRVFNEHQDTMARLPKVFSPSLGLRHSRPETSFNG